MRGMHRGALRIGAAVLVLALTQFGVDPVSWTFHRWGQKPREESPRWLVRAQTAGSTWTQLFPTGGPPPSRWEHTAVYDPTSNRMTVFGGSSFGPPTDSAVWVLANADGLGGPPSWTQLSPTGGPPSARVEHTSVYDPATNRMIMFAGNPNAGFCFGDANDVWVLSNANGLGTSAWTQLSPAGTPPSPRGHHTAVYDPASNRMTVFGGSSPAPSNDVWVLSNANGLGGTPTWTQLTPTGGPPTARTGHSAVYNSTANRMTIFAGLGCLTPTCSSIFFLN